MNKKERDETSKFLSYVLRHQPQTIGIQLDSNGWTDIDTLIQCARKHGQNLDRDCILKVVETNEKKRFSISKNGQCIRAVQGHSTTIVNLQLTEKKPPKILYHGTAARFLNSIIEKGLIPGSRHHVHLSQDEQTAMEVGKRYGKPVVLEIEALRMHQQGHQFFQAENGVWLTDQVPTLFFQSSLNDKMSDQ